MAHIYPTVRNFFSLLWYSSARNLRGLLYCRNGSLQCNHASVESLFVKQINGEYDEYDKSFSVLNFGNNLLSRRFQAFCVKQSLRQSLFVSSLVPFSLWHHVRIDVYLITSILLPTVFHC